MVGRQEPSSLSKSAGKCLTQLLDLKKDADNRLISRRNVSRTKRELLVNVVQDLNNDIQTLKAWIKEFDKAEQTENPELLEQAERLFNILYNTILDAEVTLDSRLRHRGLWEFWTNRYRVHSTPLLKN